MKFQILLFILGRKLRKKAKTDPEFKKKLAEKNCTVQIKTADNSRGRFFTFTNGDVITEKGIAPKADVSLVWKDAKNGFEVLSSGNQQRNMQALQNGELKLEGDGTTALWFVDKAKQAAR